MNTQTIALILLKGYTTVECTFLGNKHRYTYLAPEGMYVEGDVAVIKKDVLQYNLVTVANVHPKPVIKDTAYKMQWLLQKFDPPNLMDELQAIEKDIEALEDNPWAESEGEIDDEVVEIVRVDMKLLLEGKG